MNRTLQFTIFAAALLFAVGDLCASEGRIPTKAVLASVVGSDPASAEFQSFLREYDFTENPKRENSWGSAFGVFLSAGDHGIQVGIRPPSAATNMPTFSGDLPKKLKAGDSIEEIIEKLGRPMSVAHDPKAYYEMSFSGMTVYTMAGTLFEVWLVP